jgi:tetratricopeptide (TPR) repeat protein
MSRNEHEQAITSYQQALAEQSNAMEIWIELAAVYISTNSLVAAQLCYTSAIQIVEATPSALSSIHLFHLYLRLSRFYYFTDRCVLALDTLNLAMKFDVSIHCSAAYCLLGVLHCKLKQYNDAMIALNHAAQLSSPSTSHVHSYSDGMIYYPIGLVNFHLSQLYVHEQKFQLAENHACEELRSSGQHASIYHQLSIVAQQTGQLQLACQYIQRAIEIMPSTIHEQRLQLLKTMETQT